MSIFKGDLEIDCDKDKTQILCRGKRGKKEGTVLAKVGGDGEIYVDKVKGNLTIINELKEHISGESSIEIKDKRYSKGEF